MSLYQTAKILAKRRPRFRLHMYDGVRELSRALGITPEEAERQGYHPGLVFLLRTGLFDPTVCDHAPERLNDEFSGGTSRFAACDEPDRPVGQHVADEE